MFLLTFLVGRWLINDDCQMYYWVGSWLCGNILVFGLVPEFRIHFLTKLQAILSNTFLDSSLTMTFWCLLLPHWFTCLKNTRKIILFSQALQQTLSPSFVNQRSILRVICIVLLFYFYIALIWMISYFNVSLRMFYITFLNFPQPIFCHC